MQRLRTLSRRTWAVIIAVVVVFLVLGAVTQSPRDEADTASALPSPTSECESAFEDAAPRSDSEARDALLAAVGTCSTIDEFLDASGKYPDALDDADPIAYLRWACADWLSSTALCREVRGDSLTSECEAAFEAAAAIGAMEDMVEDLYPAVRACPTIDDWVDASEKYPDALDGADTIEFLGNVCEYGDDLSGTALCQELARG